MSITTQVPTFSGTLPSRTGQSPVEFDDNVGDKLDYDVIVAPAINSVAGEMNALSSDMNDVSTTTNGYKDDAEESAINSAASATASASSANMVIYNPINTYSRGNFVLGSNNIVYLCGSDVLAGDDPTTNVNGNWEQYSVLKKFPVIKTADFIFTINTPTYIDTELSEIYGSTPLNPTSGDVILFSDYNSTWGDNSFWVKYTDELLMGLSEDLEIDKYNLSGGMMFINSTVGWRLF